MNIVKNFEPIPEGLVGRSVPADEGERGEHDGVEQTHPECTEVTLVQDQQYSSQHVYQHQGRMN